MNTRLLENFKAFNSTANFSFLSYLPRFVNNYINFGEQNFHRFVRLAAKWKHSELAVLNNYLENSLNLSFQSTIARTSRLNFFSCIFICVFIFVK